MRSIAIAARDGTSVMNTATVVLEQGQSESPAHAVVDEYAEDTGQYPADSGEGTLLLRVNQ